MEIRSPENTQTSFVSPSSYSWETHFLDMLGSSGSECMPRLLLAVVVIGD
jgi:hypothetical protein